MPTVVAYHDIVKDKKAQEAALAKADALVEPFVEHARVEHTPGDNAAVAEEGAALVNGVASIRVPRLSGLGARLRRSGDDVLLVSWGPAVHTCLAAAQELEDQHAVGAAVLDLRRLSPIDDTCLFEAAAARRRVVVVHEGVRTAGLGAEVVARLQEALAETIQLPVLRVTAPDTPYPPGRLEDEFLPSPARVVAAALKVVGLS